MTQNAREREGIARLGLARFTSRMRRRTLFGVVAAMGTTACGASIQAVYEGDVRFEHCMALDSRPDIKPTIRKACWEEWVRFYTFGQTRDRVEHARRRERQLSASSDFDEGDWSETPRAPAAVPEPTTVLAPPPMMLVVDAGAPPEASDAGETVVEEGPPPGAACAGECDESWKLCRADCRSSSCEKGCTGKYKRCMRRCF